MRDICLTQSLLDQYRHMLVQEEKSAATISKYMRDTTVFCRYLDGAPVTKEAVLAYKNLLIKRGYAPRSVNSMIISINQLLKFLRLDSCRVKTLRLQHQAYCPENAILTRSDYLQLLRAAGRDDKIRLVLQTICSTGIRVSELQHFTCEAVCHGEIRIVCKGKTRTILIPAKLKKLLQGYARRHGITAGIIFRSRKGKPLSRGTIWAAMKRLCARAGIAASKVFPHNLRKLFARSFYSIDKDIAKLADVLGHSSIETTRLYIVTTGREHRRQLDLLRLLI